MTVLKVVPLSVLTLSPSWIFDKIASFVSLNASSSTSASSTMVYTFCSMPLPMVTVAPTAKASIASYTFLAANGDASVAFVVSPLIVTLSPVENTAPVVPPVFDPALARVSASKSLS